MSDLLGTIKINLNDGGILSVEHDKIPSYFRDKIICENGTIYSAEKFGILPDVLYEWFNRRKEYESLRVECLNKLKTETDESIKKELKNKAIFHNNSQKALKILINSIYGSLGTSYSRLFDVDNAEAVTYNGQYIVLEGRRIVNDFLSKGIFAENNEFVEILNQMGLWNKEKTNDLDYIIAMDTDSLFINFGIFIKKIFIKFHQEWTEKEMISFVLQLSKIVEKYLNEEANKLFNYRMNLTIDHPQKINFKQEIVGTSGIFTTKKRYAIRIKHKKGISTDELEIKGLETQKSDVPEFIRKRLKGFLEMILDTDVKENQILQFIESIKSDYQKLHIREQAFPKNCNDIDKYVLPNFGYAKGSPIHVKSAINHNKFLHLKKINNRIQEIKNHNKIKFFYLKPNPYNFDVFGYAIWYPEFDEIANYFDIEKMAEKLIDDKVVPILDILGISLTKLGGNLSELFE